MSHCLHPDLSPARPTLGPLASLGALPLVAPGLQDPQACTSSCHGACSPSAAQTEADLQIEGFRAAAGHAACQVLPGPQLCGVLTFSEARPRDPVGLGQPPAVPLSSSSTLMWAVCMCAWVCTAVRVHACRMNQAGVSVGGGRGPGGLSMGRSGVGCVRPCCEGGALLPAESLD